MLIGDITHYLESRYPLSLQESYDNSGLIIHDENRYLSLKSFSEENNMYLYKHKEPHLRAHHQSFF